MDKKQQLIKLYEANIDKISDMRADINSLADMTDEQLIVLVEKAGKCSRVQKKAWEQICGNDVDRKDVRIILSHRNEIKEDMAKIQKLENEVNELEKETEEQQALIKKQKQISKKSRIKKRNKMIVTMSFGVMFLCSICFHLLMLKLYHGVSIPAVILLSGIPFAGSLIFGFSFKKEMGGETNQQVEILEDMLQENIDQMNEKKETLSYYQQKYDSVFDEMDEYLWQIYPYVEKILEKLDYREDYQKARNEYQGIMEILHFKQPEEYVYFPEIFLIEEEQEMFIQNIQEKMRKMDEYLVQTIETA